MGVTWWWNYVLRVALPSVIVVIRHDKDGFTLLRQVALSHQEYHAAWVPPVCRVIAPSFGASLTNGHSGG